MTAATFFSIFSEYLRILISICLPVVILSAVLAIWLHYRQKRRRRAKELLEPETTDDLTSTLLNASRSTTISPLAPEDKIGLIRECRKQLRKSRAKFLALKSDFTNSIKNIASNSFTENTSAMHPLNDKIAVYETQIQELQEKLEVLETVVPDQDESWHLRQTLKEKEIEIDQLKKKIEQVLPGELSGISGIDIRDSALAESALQHKIDQLLSVNAELIRQLGEQKEELTRQQQLLETIYQGIQTTHHEKKKEIVQQSLS